MALRFSKTYPVVLLARNPANFESVVKEINSAGGQAIGISTDVSSPSSVQNAFSEIKKEFKDKKLAAAIYNVGGKFVRKPFLETSLEEYEAGYEANGYVPTFLSFFPISFLKLEGTRVLADDGSLQKGLLSLRQSRTTPPSRFRF